MFWIPAMILSVHLLLQRSVIYLLLFSDICSYYLCRYNTIISFCKHDLNIALTTSIVIYFYRNDYLFYLNLWWLYLWYYCLHYIPIFFFSLFFSLRFTFIFNSVLYQKILTNFHWYQSPFSIVNYVKTLSLFLNG